MEKLSLVRSEKTIFLNRTCGKNQPRVGSGGEERDEEEVKQDAPGSETSRKKRSRRRRRRSESILPFLDREDDASAEALRTFVHLQERRVPTRRAQTFLTDPQLWEKQGSVRKVRVGDSGAAAAWSSVQSEVSAVSHASQPTAPTSALSSSSSSLLFSVPENF